MKSLKSLLLVAAALAVLPGCSNPSDGEAESHVAAPADTKTEIAAADSTSAPDGSTVDDFSDPKKNSLGVERQFIDDTTAGGRSTTQHAFENGVLSAKGNLVPARGQPGWASIALPLNAQELPEDASAYQGVRLVLRVNKGNLSVSANSTEITNFDFHASIVVLKNDGEFHEVKIPFSEMKRAWSAQTKLNTKTLNSLSLVAFGLQKGPFDFEFDEVGFY